MVDLGLDLCKVLSSICSRPDFDQKGNSSMFEKNYKADVEAAQKDIDFTSNCYQVELDTSAGKITLDLLPDVAPNHCKNIIGLARSGFYDGIIFHRIVPGFVIQAGCPKGVGTGGPGYRVKAEFNETPHVAGVLSMARAQDPDSAGSQFFLCLGKAAFLDRQYTAFGRTADDSSLAVVKAIGEVDTDDRDRPVENVTINKATVKVEPRA
jgi:peptidyl-prolyl cis-trans isomerase B (cyclophilin B)